jgi:hypothetical protein
MSGAAAIAAAKNRRGRAEANQRQQLPPPISCGKNNTCPPQNKQANNKSAPVQNRSVQPSSNNLVDPESLQILGPLPPAQILRLHEQRLNKIDEKFITLCGGINACSTANACSTNTDNNIVQLDTVNEAVDDNDLGEELFGRIDALENKLTMLEEVIMTLQNKLTISQNFAMETSMSVTSLAKENQKAIDRVLAQVQTQVREQVQAQVREQVQAQVQAHLETHAQLTDTSSIDVTNVTEPASPNETNESASLDVANENNISVVIIDTIN